jgi:hypothetical protein
MATPNKIDLGAFAEGEVPPVLAHIFTDFDNNPVDISSFTTIQMNIEAVPPVTGPLGGGTIGFQGDGTDGVVEYYWSATDMAGAASYTAQVWVSNGVNKYASDLILYTVYDGPGSAP